MHATYSQRIIIATVLAAIITLMGANCDPVGAASARSLTAPPHFQQILDSVAKDNQVSIVAEGTPLLDTLSDQAQSELERKLSTAKSADEEVAFVAAAYDYRSVRDADGVYELVKLYSDARDLPFVTPEEATTDFLRIIKCIQSVADIRNDPENYSAELKGISASLTADQAAMLAQGLPVTSLTDAQRDALWRMCSHAAYDAPVDSLARDATFLIALQSPSTLIHNVESPLFGQKVFAIDGPFWLNGDKMQFGAGYGYEIDPACPGALIAQDGVRFAIDQPDETVLGPPSALAVSLFHQHFHGPPYRDPDAPTAEDISLAEQSEKPRDTIGDLIQRLQSPLLPDGSKAYRLIVEPYLAPKPITVAGEKYASPLRLARAVVGIYGLELHHPVINLYRLTCVSGRLPSNMAELSDAVRAAFPASLERALHGHYNIALAKAVEDNKAQGKNVRFISPLAIESGVARRSYHEAIRRIRAMIEPQLGEGKKDSVKAIAAGAEVRRLLTLASLNISYVHLCRFVENPVPNYLSDFNQNKLVSHPGPGGNPTNAFVVQHSPTEIVGSSIIEFRWPIPTGRVTQVSGADATRVDRNGK